jgi:hypothetical protein
MQLSRDVTEGGTKGVPSIWLCECAIDAPADAPWFLNTYFFMTKGSYSLAQEEINKDIVQGC